MGGVDDTARRKYQIPDPMVDARELRKLDELTKRYEEMTSPGLFSKAKDAVVDFLPESVKKNVDEALHQLTEQEIYQQMMQIVSEGFASIEKLAASATVSEESVVRAFSKAFPERGLNTLSEICLFRSYDVSKVANSRNYQHSIAALLEGAATGAAGFPGIPFSLVLSTLLYYRAVQSIAMYYGYDVKGDPSEMVIAGEVFAASLAPKGADLGGAIGLVGKIMAIAEVASVGQVVKKGWQAMAEHGGVCLLIAQLRALAHAAAKRALQKAGQEGLEKSIFRAVLEQVGRKLPQKAVQRGVPIVGGLIGALFDTGQMQRVLMYADTFYHKRFLIEKELRVMSLVEGFDLDSDLTDSAVGDGPTISE